MITKVLEIRDRNTFIPVLAVDMNPDFKDRHTVDISIAQRYLLRRAGYACDCKPIILLTRLDGGRSTYDPYDWGDRTWKVAHDWIEKNWFNLSDGDVVDVEYILGERDTPKISERYEATS